MFEPKRSYPLILLSLALVLFTKRYLFVWTPIALVAALIIKPAVLEWPSRILETIGKGVGTTLSSIALGIVFYIFVTPYGFFYRLRERALVSYFFKPADSEYTQVNRTYQREDFEKTW